MRTSPDHSARYIWSAKFRPPSTRFAKSVLTTVLVLASLSFLTLWQVREPSASRLKQEAGFQLPGQASVAVSLSTVTQTAPFEPMVQPPVKVTTANPPYNENWSHVEVAPGDNLSVIFSRLQLSSSDLHQMSMEKDGVLLRRLFPGQQIRIEHENHEVKQLLLQMDDFRTLEVKRTTNGYSFEEQEVQPEFNQTTVAGTLTRSLFLDGQAAGLSDSTIMKLTEIFGWDIDFALDMRQGDTFSVIFDEILKNGEVLAQGKIKAAEFVNQGKTYRAVLFEEMGGSSNYYSESGQAMRKAFLRTPVNFSRISSRFNLRRKHPVLNKIRAHRGVDYAAPMGTPVRATADGVVSFLGRNGGYGQTIELRHGQAYGTLYAHLARFAKNLKKGSRVTQGEVIGYVGQSGLATGPHLHYEFRLHGTHRNPLTVELPPAASVPSDRLAVFRESTRPYLEQLNNLRDLDSLAAERLMAQAEKKAHEASHLDQLR